MDPYCRCSKWPPLAATQAVKHLGQFATTLLMCSCASSSKMVCKATFKSSIIFGFGWSVVLFQHGTPDVIVQRVQIWRDWGQWFFSMNPAWHTPCELGCYLVGRWSLDSLCRCQWWSLQASAIRVHSQVCVLISAPENQLFSESPTYYQRKQRPKCS